MLLQILLLLQELRLFVGPKTNPDTAGTRVSDRGCLDEM